VQRLLATVLAVAYSHAALCRHSRKEVRKLFHIGGARRRPCRAATKDIVFHRRPRPIKATRNGEFEVEQMYSSTVKLASPKAQVRSCCGTARPLRVTWETKPTASPLASSFSSMAGYDVYVCGPRSSAAAGGGRPGAYPEIFKGEAAVPHPRRSPGSCFGSRPPTRSGQARRVRCP